MGEHGSGCLEGRCLYLQSPRNRRHSTPCRATWGSTRVSHEAEGRKGKDGQEPFFFFPLLSNLFITVLGTELRASC
jgi:hypothetical protein